MSMKEKEPGLWLLDVRVWKSGKEFRRREEVHGGQKAADARAAEIRKELQARSEKEPRSLKVTEASTFQEALDFYLNRNDVGSNRHYFERLKCDMGAVPLCDLAEHFDKWVLLMRQSRSKQTGRALKPATINRFIAWSKAALNYCVAFGVIKSNPLSHFRKAKEIPRDIALNDINRKNLFNVLEREASFLVPLVKFALLVPCRTGELLQMRRDNLDLFNNAIRVGCGVMKNKEMAAWKPIPPSMREYFINLPPASEFLFPRKIGERFERIKVFPYGLFRRCLKLAGLMGWRLHDARHEAVSSMLNHNTPEAVVCMVAGWSSTAMLRTYYHRDGLQSLKMVRFGPEISAKPDTVRSTLMEAI
ncbi:MAG: tyrosine-type recombinase/integrase [Chitinivibrionales bacterium]